MKLTRLKAHYLTEKRAAIQATIRQTRNLFLCLIMIATLQAASCSPSEVSPPGPNLLVLVVDALRPDHMGCYGYDRPTTPNLDFWARRARIVERTYAQAPLTPTSVASILTSCYPGTHRLVGGHEGIVANWDRARVLSSDLKSRGWRTAIFSANPLVGREWSFDEGFDYFVHRPWESASRLNEDLEDWMEQRAKMSERFFAYVHYMDPHDPYTPRTSTFRRTPNPFPDGEINSFHHRIREGKSPGLSSEDLHAMIDLYDGEIRETDQEMGWLLAWLDRRSLLQSTAVALTADHGESFLEHGRLKHGSHIYEEAVRVPLILWLPDRRTRGTLETGPAETIDVLPTLMASVGIDLPEGIQGRNLLGPDSMEAAHTMTWSGWDPLTRSRTAKRGLIQRDWKLIQTVETDELELFFLGADPQERTNLRQARPRIAERLEAQLEDRFGSVQTLIDPDETGIGPRLREQMRSMGYIQ